jgi:Domain of unknown function (DUF4124)
VTKGIKLLLTLLILGAACYTIAEVYRVINEDGSVSYTDNPPAGDPTVESVSLPPINTQPALETKTVVKKVADKEEFAGYNQISILSPASGTTIPPGHQEIPVEISLEPSLHSGHLIQLMFNGQPYGPPTTSTLFNINSVARGEHSIQARVLDSERNTVGQSNSVTVYVKRHSIKHNTN